jgi:hypothetical protein
MPNSIVQEDLVTEQSQKTRCTRRSSTGCIVTCWQKTQFPCERATDYLTKPVKPTLVWSRVRAWLQPTSTA